MPSNQATTIAVDLFAGAGGDTGLNKQVLPQSK